MVGMTLNPKHHSHINAFLQNYAIINFSRKIGLEARRKFVQPIGAWFSQVGELHQVIHMWHYHVREVVCPTVETISLIHVISAEP